MREEDFIEKLFVNCTWTWIYEYANNVIFIIEYFVTTGFSGILMGEIILSKDLRGYDRKENGS